MANIPQMEWTDIEPAESSVQPPRREMETEWTDIPESGPAINPRHFDNPDFAIKAAELAALYNGSVPPHKELRARVLECQRLKSYLQVLFPSSNSGLTNSSPRRIRGLQLHKSGY